MGGADSPRWQRSHPRRRWRLVSIIAVFWLLIPVSHGVARIVTHLTHHSSTGMHPTTVSPTVAAFPTQPLPDALTVGPGAVVSASGNRQSQTFACNGGTLRLSGNSNTFTVAGHCLKVEVSGNYTHVTVDSADTIDAGGTYTVTVYHWGTPKSPSPGSASP